MRALFRSFVLMSMCVRSFNVLLISKSKFFLYGCQLHQFFLLFHTIVVSNRSQFTPFLHYRVKSIRFVLLFLAFSIYSSCYTNECMLYLDVRRVKCMMSIEKLVHLLTISSCLCLCLSLSLFLSFRCAKKKTKLQFINI